MSLAEQIKQAIESAKDSSSYALDYRIGQHDYVIRFSIMGTLKGVHVKETDDGVPDNDETRHVVEALWAGLG